MEANLPHVTRRGLSPLRAMNLDYPSEVAPGQIGDGWERAEADWRVRRAPHLNSTGFLAAFHAQPGAVKGETNE